jgi:hypothetical protein
MQPHPSSAYLRLSEGPDDLLANELSLTRRLLTLFVAFVLFSGTSLFATAALDLDHGLIDKALAANSKASHDGDGDNSGPGGGDDDDDTDTGTDNVGTQSDDSSSDQSRDGTTDSSRGQQATDSNSDDNRNGASDSSKAQQSDDSNSDDNRDGASDSSRGASVSMRSHATSDGRGDHTRG